MEKKLAEDSIIHDLDSWTANQKKSRNPLFPHLVSRGEESSKPKLSGRLLACMVILPAMGTG